MYTVREEKWSNTYRSMYRYGTFDAIVIEEKVYFDGLGKRVQQICETAAVSLFNVIVKGFIACAGKNCADSKVGIGV